MNLKRFLDNFLGGHNGIASQPKLEARDPAITLISLIYSTAPKTFTGDAVYVTQTVPTVQATDVSGQDDDSTTVLGKTTSRAAASSTSRTSATLASPASSASATSGTSSATSGSSNSSSSNIKAATSAAASATNSPVVTSAPASSGMSGGAKAGLAFGLIILFALIGAGIFFILKKRKREAEEGERLDDEKAFFANGRNPDALPAHTTANTSSSRLSNGDYYSEKPVPPQPVASANDADRHARFSYEETAAPRLSLRGVSQFGSMGNLNENGPLSAASSQALPAAGAAALAAAGGLGIAGAMANRDRSNTVKNNDPNNPFGNHAEKLDSPAANAQRPLSPGALGGRRSPGPQAADFPLPDSTPASPNASKPSSPQPSKAQVANGAAAAGGAAAIAAATAAAASNTPQGGPVADNVYRVQIDFKPSMDDELDISAGQLVRVLHEYDDGWALCIRMDRSKQGVVPRTCLSKHAVKPRPASPGGRPGPRGPPPPGMRGPPGFGPPRPHSPASGRNSPGPRSMSPAPFGNQSRPLTPTQQNGRERAGSNAPYAQHPGMRAASPGPNGGSRLRPQEGSPQQQQQRFRSESNAQSGLRNAQTPPSKIPGPVVSRKPVGSS